MKTKLKEILWHLLILLLFVVVSYAYFSPIIEGKSIRQADLEHTMSVGREAANYYHAENRSIAWTNSLFGGMPTYQIGAFKTYSFFYYIQYALSHALPYGTVSSLFLYLLGFYILLLSLKLDKFTSVIGALAFGLSSYNIIIIAAGHISKTYAIAYMPIAIAGFIYLFDRKYIWGAILATLGLGLELVTGHVQIVYYTAIAVAIFYIFSFFWHLKEKQLKNFGISTLFAAISVVFAILPNIGQFWRTYEAGKHSMRGKSELTLDKNVKKTTGLEREYAFSWSYGIDETWTILIPNVKGGASGYLGNNNVAMKNIDSNFAEIISQQNHYWGDQPFTSGPVYFGAIIMFLFVLGMFILDNKLKWWILVATIVSIILSWGKNFPLVNDFLFNYLPLYNKFRSVSMTLVIASVTIPMLAALTLKEIIEKKEILKEKRKYFYISLGLTAGIALVLWLIPTFFNFISADETKMFDDYLKQLPADQHSQIYKIIDQLKEARIAIFKADAIRTVLYIVLAAAILLFYSISKNMKKGLTLGLIAMLVVIDMWVVDRRYLGSKDFVSKKKTNEFIQPKPVDVVIQKDKDLYFRVLNLTTNPFSDAFTSGFHKSIGGYHGAKLMIYQELIDYYLMKEVQILAQSFSDSVNTPNVVLPQLQVLNMLNTKYLVLDPNSFPYPNPNAYGNGWFVDIFKFVKNANEEIQSLGTENLKRTAIINESKFKVDELKSILPSNDTSRYVQITEYKPDYLKFEVNSKQGGFVVFSDIYYPGWQATVDGTEHTIYKTNYVLRGITVPAGKHTVIFSFRPAAIFVAQKIEIASSILLFLLILGAIYIKQKKCKTQENN